MAHERLEKYQSMCSVSRKSVGNMEWQLCPSDDRAVTTLACTVLGWFVQLVYSLRIDRTEVGLVLAVDYHVSLKMWFCQ